MTDDAITRTVTALAVLTQIICRRCACADGSDGYIPIDLSLRAFVARIDAMQSLATNEQFAQLATMLVRSLCGVADVPRDRVALSQVLDTRPQLLRAHPSRRAHAGADYDVVLLVVCENVTKKLTDRLAALAENLEEACDTLASARHQNPPASPLHGRLVLLCTTPTISARHIAAMVGKRFVARVTLELWYVDELQWDPTQHERASLHEPFDALTDEERACDGYETHWRTAIREPHNLGRLKVDDRQARCVGLARGQVVRIRCVDSRAGGVRYEYKQMM